MKKQFLGAAILAAATVVACSDGNDESPRAISLNTSINHTATRVASDDNGSEYFTEGDVLSVYAWKGDATAVGELIINGTENTLTNGTWVSSPQMLWTDMVTRHYFLGIYPARTVTDFTADGFELQTPDVAANDLLIATNLVGLTAEQNPVALVFNHAMAKVVVNLDYRNQWNGNLPEVTEVSVTAATHATIDYLATPAVTAQGEVSEYPLVALDSSLQYSSIMVPQSTFRVIRIVIDGQTFTYTNNGPISLQAGKITTVNLIVGRDKIELNDVSISNWEEGETISGGEAL
jgi:hypothetical protein